jgi:hypothetical protein
VSVRIELEGGVGRREGHFTATGIRANADIVLPSMPMQRCVVLYGKRRHPFDTVAPVDACELAQEVGSKHLGADADVSGAQELPHDGIDETESGSSYLELHENAFDAEGARHLVWTCLVPIWRLVIYARVSARAGALRAVDTLAVLSIAQSNEVDMEHLCSKCLCPHVLALPEAQSLSKIRLGALLEPD